jgi:hypothetical protein
MIFSPKGLRRAAVTGKCHQTQLPPGVHVPFGNHLTLRTLPRGGSNHM